MGSAHRSDITTNNLALSRYLVLTLQRENVNDLSPQRGERSLILEQCSDDIRGCRHHVQRVLTPAFRRGPTADQAMTNRQRPQLQGQTSHHRAMRR